MSNEELTESIIELLGGRENIENAVNCMTHVRVQLLDDALVQEDALKQAEGVLGVVHNRKNYIEVVVGPGKAKKCVDFFREKRIPGSSSGETKPAAEPPNNSIHKYLLKQFSRIFSPLIPGITAAGICAGVASLISQVYPGSKESSGFLPNMKIAPTGHTARQCWHRQQPRQPKRSNSFILGYPSAPNSITMPEQVLIHLLHLMHLNLSI